MKAALIPIFFALLSCADRPLVYTGSQLGVHASGLKNSVPEKLSVGYDRNEYAWLPKGGSSSVQGSYDTEYRYPASIAISESLITGKAAAGEISEHQVEDGNRESEESDLIVSTNTKTNLGIEGAPTDGSSFSFNFGFKRSVLALFPRQKDPTSNGELPSSYTDISVHANGALGKLNNPQAIAESRQMTGDFSGARIVQTIATGKAAENLTHGEEGENLRSRIAAGLIPIPKKNP